MKGSALGKLTRLCCSISEDENLISELEKEINQRCTKEFSALKTILINQLKSTSLSNLGFNESFLSIFFYPNTITEIELYSDMNLGIKCFFMSKGTIFPMHDHSSRVIITAVLFGSIKYVVLDKTPATNVMTLLAKGTGKVGKVMFTTLNTGNVHAIYAEKDSIIIDIFMHNINEPESYFKINKKQGREFLVEVDHHVFFLTRSFKPINCECSSRAWLDISLT